MSETKAAVLPAIKISIVPTEGKVDRVIEFTGSKWSELKEQLRPYYPNIDNMKVIESTRRNTLEHPSALVAKKDHLLFLMPMKNKSGAKSAPKKDAPAKKAAAKKAASKKEATKKAEAKPTKTAKKAAPKKAAKVSKDKAEAIADVVESVKVAKEEFYDANPNDFKEIRGGVKGVL